MGFLDFFKNIFKKKEPPLISPGEMPQQEQPVNTDGQFQTPQNTANPQEQNQTGTTQPPGAAS